MAPQHLRPGPHPELLQQAHQGLHLQVHLRCVLIAQALVVQKRARRQGRQAGLLLGQWQQARW